MKAKGPAAAKDEGEKKKGLELFRPKPPTPQMLRAFGRFNKKTFMEKLKVENSVSVFWEFKNFKDMLEGPAAKFKSCCFDCLLHWKQRFFTILLYYSDKYAQINSLTDSWFTLHFLFFLFFRSQMHKSDKRTVSLLYIFVSYLCIYVLYLSYFRFFYYV